MRPPPCRRPISSKMLPRLPVIPTSCPPPSPMLGECTARSPPRPLPWIGRCPFPRTAPFVVGGLERLALDSFIPSVVKRLPAYKAATGMCGLCVCGGGGLGWAICPTFVFHERGSVVLACHHRKMCDCVWERLFKWVAPACGSVAWTDTHDFRSPPGPDSYHIRTQSV